MAVILNKWIEKIKKKRAPETAPAFKSDAEDTWLPVNPKKVIIRHTKAACAILHKTLRGLRK